MDRIARFMDKVSPEPNSGCWLWVGACGPDGYGSFGCAPSRSEGAHRSAYKLFVGNIPNGMFVMHKCDNTSCVNPDHLRIGTPRQNSNDRDAKGRAAIGVRNGKAVLNDDLVRLILQSPLSRRKLAAEIGVSAGAISAVRERRVWKHVDTRGED